MAFGEACERITTCVLASLLLLAVLGSVSGRDPTVAWTTLRVRLTATAVRGSPAATVAAAADALQTARADAAAERFSAALAAWLPRQRAAVAGIDEVLATRKQLETLTDLRVVIVYVCPNGLGNRLPGLVTALALAMMTDRALLVRDFSPEGFFGSFAPAFDCEGTVERIETVAGIPGCRHATLFNSNRRDLALVDSMLLDDLGQRFADDHLLHYTSCDYHMPLLQGNQHYRRWVTDMAPAFATVGRPLLQPKADIVADAQRIYSEHVTPGDIVVGVQMRTQKRTRLHPPVRWYADVALAVGLQLAPPGRLRFLVASDSPLAVADFTAAVTATLSRDFPTGSDGELDAASSSSSSSGSSVVFGSEGDQTTRGALLDMLLLGMTNETVITYGSSFGYVATAWANRVPYYVQHLYEDHVYRDPDSIGGKAVPLEGRVADDHVFFWKGVVAEPCFFDSKSLLTGVFSRNDSALHDRMVAAFKSNVYWMQYSQCQWNTERSEQ